MSMKEGQYSSGPPLLEEPNYSYWKTRMKAFLKTLDERVTERTVLSLRCNVLCTNKFIFSATRDYTTG
ncbi:unnamed protein product [Rhodiola kirilowii]